MSRVLVREERGDDAPALAALFTRAFGEPMPEEVWRWKYAANPFGRCAVVGERSGGAGRLVAYYGGWATRMRGEGGSFGALLLSDTMTDPDVRGGAHRPVLAELDGFFAPLARERGFDFCFGFPNAAAARFGQKWLGYRLVPPLRLLTLETASAPEERAAFAAAGDSFPEAHDALWGRLATLPGLRADRSRGTLNWRYHARPARYYRVVHAGDSEDELHGYAVVVVAGEIAQILDFQVDGLSFAAPLVAELARDLASSGAKRFELALPEGELAARLRLLGFADSEDRNRLGVRDLGVPGLALRLAPGLDLRAGDSDVY